MSLQGRQIQTRLCYFYGYYEKGRYADTTRFQPLKNEVDYWVEEMVNYIPKLLQESYLQRTEGLILINQPHKC